jgi:guanylate kinase
MKMYNLVAIYGKSGAGKDTLLKRLCRYRKYNKVISYTTRPQREGEVAELDYHFIDNFTFLGKVAQNKMLEYVEFKDGWFYGTCIDDLRTSKINIGVYDPHRLMSLIELAKKEPDKYNILFCFLDASDKTLLSRSLNREEYPDCQEICRRFLADKEDFCNFDKWLDTTPIDLKNIQLLAINADDEWILHNDAIQSIMDRIDQYFS